MQVVVCSVKQRSCGRTVAASPLPGASGPICAPAAGVLGVLPEAAVGAAADGAARLVMGTCSLHCYYRPLKARGTHMAAGMPLLLGRPCTTMLATTQQLARPSHFEPWMQAARIGLLVQAVSSRFGSITSTYLKDRSRSVLLTAQMPECSVMIFVRPT